MLIIQFCLMILIGWQRKGFQKREIALVTASFYIGCRAGLKGPEENSWDPAPAKCAYIANVVDMKNLVDIIKNLEKEK